MAGRHSDEEEAAGEHLAERVHPPRIVVFYSRPSLGIAIVNKESRISIHDPDPGTVDPDCDTDRRQSLTDWFLGHVPPFQSIITNIIAFIKNINFYHYI